MKVDYEIIFALTEFAQRGAQIAQDMVAWKGQDVVDVGKASYKRGELGMHDPVDFRIQLRAQLVDRRQNMEYVAEGAEFDHEYSHSADAK